MISSIAWGCDETETPEPDPDPDLRPTIHTQEVQDTLHVLQQEGGRPLAQGFSLEERCRWKERLATTQVGCSLDPRAGPPLEVPRRAS